MFSCEFCEISKNTLHYRTPLVAAFVYWMHKLNALARLLRITTFFIGELEMVEIRRVLDLEVLRQLIGGILGVSKLAEGAVVTDDEHVVAHVAELIVVNKL